MGLLPEPGATGTLKPEGAGIEFAVMSSSLIPTVVGTQSTLYSPAIVVRYLRRHPAPNHSPSSMLLCSLWTNVNGFVSLILSLKQTEERVCVYGFVHGMHSTMCIYMMYTKYMHITGGLF